MYNVTKTNQFEINALRL